MKHFILSLVAMLLSLSAFAVPAHPGLMKARDAHGTEMQVRLVGDEFLHYYVNPQTGVRYLPDAIGTLQELSAVQLSGMQQQAETRREAMQEHRLRRLSAPSLDRQETTGAHLIGQYRDMIGSKKGLVILVNFADTKMTFGQEEFEAQFNEEGYNHFNHIGSVHDYFYDQSYGMFDLSFDVVGPVTVSKEMAYYGEKTAVGHDAYPATMVIEACRLADEAGVDFSKYDWDSDGEVDQVYVVYAGYGEAYGASSNTIWPHEWTLTYAAYTGDGTGPQRYDGVKIDTYACSCELAWRTGTRLNGIGTACHEFSHCLGYPDLYDTQTGLNFGMSVWDLLDEGCYSGPGSCGEVPCGYTSYERWCAGWLKPVALEEPANVVNMKPLNDEPEAYIVVNDGNQDEYLLLENRNNDRWFTYTNTSTDAFGLLILHVDYNASQWASNTVNVAKKHQRLTIVPGGGRYDSNYPRHPFAGSSAVLDLTETSHQSTGGEWFTACSTGSTELNHTVTEITYDKETRLVSFLFDGGHDDSLRRTLRYVAGSGSCELASWTQQEYGEDPILPDVTPFYPELQFLGWTTDSTQLVTSSPSTILLPGSTYKLRKDETLYAVYSYNLIPLNGDIFRLVEVLTEGQEYVLVAGTGEGTRYALDPASLDPMAVMTCTGAPVQVTSEEGVLTVRNADNSIVWTCNYSAGGQINVFSDSKHLMLGSSGLSAVYSTPTVHIDWSTSTGMNYTEERLVRRKVYFVKAGKQDQIVVSTGESKTDRLLAFQRVGQRPTLFYANTFFGSGDLNLDGEVNLQDLDVLNNLILRDAAPSLEADMDGNGVLSVADLTLLIEKLSGR